MKLDVMCYCHRLPRVNGARISHYKGSSVTIIPRHWLNFCEYEIGKKKIGKLIGATGAILDTEQNLVNVRIGIKVDGSDDIPLVLNNVAVVRRYTPYIILGTTDLRNGSPNLDLYFRKDFKCDALIQKTRIFSN